MGEALAGGIRGAGALSGLPGAAAALTIGALTQIVTDTGSIPAYELLNHYTTRAGYLGILSSGVIRLSADGFAYMTPGFYSSGTSATGFGTDTGRILYRPNWDQ